MVFSSTPKSAEAGAVGSMLIPLIRAAATIGFVISPCSLGFVIIAVSEQLIRSIMIGDDPEMLVSDLQNRFPDEAIELKGNDEAGLAAKAVELIDCPNRGVELPLVWDALQKALDLDKTALRVCNICHDRNYTHTGQSA